MKTFLIIALAASALAAPCSADDAVVRWRCGQGMIAVGGFETRILGAIMLRGHAPLVIAQRVPVATRAFFHFGVGDNAVEGDDVDVSPREAESFMEHTDGLFHIAHPLSLFRDNFAELDRLQAIRIKALEVLRNEMVESRNRIAEKLSTEEMQQQEQEALSAAQGVEEPTMGPEDAVDPDPGMRMMDQTMDAPVVSAEMESEAEWTAVNILGLVLLSISFVLFVVMVTLSVTSLAFCCPEEETSEKAAVAEPQIDTPLLQTYEVAYVPKCDGNVVMNPVAKYEPPSAK